MGEIAGFLIRTVRGQIYQEGAEPSAVVWMRSAEIANN
jgi:hypothetical protein